MSREAKRKARVSAETWQNSMFIKLRSTPRFTKDDDDHDHDQYTSMLCRQLPKVRQGFGLLRGLVLAEEEGGLGDQTRSSLSASVVLSIQVTKSHELILICPFLTQARRVQVFLVNVVREKSCCNSQTWQTPCCHSFSKARCSGEKGICVGTES